MENDIRELLRKVRLANDISVEDAAHWAMVNARTWRSYEVDGGKGSARKLQESTLSHFFNRSGINAPYELRRYLDSDKSARTISITTFKGGVGKSPITINVAACLVSKGFKVAIVTDDGVFRGKCKKGQGPEPESLVGKISFYDESDIVFSEAEIEALEKSIRKNLERARNDQFGFYEFLSEDLSRRLRRKQNAVGKFEDLKDCYDYILLDMNRNVEVLRNEAGLIVVILSTDCGQSVDSAECLIRQVKEVSSRRRQPYFFGLMTKCDVGGKSGELLEYVGDHVMISEGALDLPLSNRTPAPR